MIRKWLGGLGVRDCKGHFIWAWQGWCVLSSDKWLELMTDFLTFLNQVWCWIASNFYLIACLAFSYLISRNLPLFFLKRDIAPFLTTAHSPYIPATILVHINNLTVLGRAGGEVNRKKPILLAPFILYFSVGQNLEITSTLFITFSGCWNWCSSSIWQLGGLLEQGFSL